MVADGCLCGELMFYFYFIFAIRFSLLYFSFPESKLFIGYTKKNIFGSLGKGINTCTLEISIKDTHSISSKRIFDRKLVIHISIYD